MTPFDEALEFINTIGFGTHSGSSLAKLILSLYNSRHAFSFSECTEALDRERLNLAGRMVQHYLEHGEEDSLLRAGRAIYEKWPRLIELSEAAFRAKADVRESWRRQAELKVANENNEIE